MIHNRFNILLSLISVFIWSCGSDRTTGGYFDYQTQKVIFNCTSSYLEGELESEFWSFQLDFTRISKSDLDIHSKYNDEERFINLNVYDSSAKLRGTGQNIFSFEVGDTNYRFMSTSPYFLTKIVEKEDCKEIELKFLNPSLQDIVRKEKWCKSLGLVEFISDNSMLGSSHKCVAD